MKPLAIDLFCGLGGWSEGLLAEGYEVIGFDIEQHRYPARTTIPSNETKNTGGSWFQPPPGRKCRGKNCPDGRASGDVRYGELTEGWIEYPAQLVIQDVRTLHGSQFKDAALIVASPPCQAYSYRAMPWKRAKALPPPDNELFDACFRIQREACEAAGRHIPMVVENVRGAQKWVGRARWKFGSFYLWGDVPALMPPMAKAVGLDWNDRTRKGQAFNTHAERAHKLPGFRFDGSGRSFQSASVEGVKQGGDWFAEGRKGGGGGTSASFGSKSSARKFASAMIAKIPLTLSRHIAKTYYPHEARDAQ